jgi:hypothetical protein
MKGATLTGATLAGADFTRTDLTSAVLAGVVASDLKLAYANLSFADLRNVKLTNANLTNATLVGATVTGTYEYRYGLPGSDLSNANLANADFTYANLELTNFTGADATKANFTRADLTAATLTKADLSGANMTWAFLARANLINATLTNVVWDNTVCPHSNSSSGGCSAFATEPEGPEYVTDRESWFQYRSPATPALPSLALVGAPDTPLAWEGSQNRDDGIQGNITNLTGQRIVVKSYGIVVPNLDSSSSANKRGYSEAILEPNAVMPYMLGPEGTLEFLKAPDGQAVGPGPRLYISDGPSFATKVPSRFYPPGWKRSVNTRTDWQPEESHEEIWGPVRLWVKRELDGWKIPASQEYISRYGDPNKKSSDWKVFTIEVRSL